MTFHLRTQTNGETTFEDASEAIGAFTAAFLRGEKPKLYDDNQKEVAVAIEIPDTIPDHTQN